MIAEVFVFIAFELFRMSVKSTLRAQTNDTLRLVSDYYSIAVDQSVNSPPCAVGDFRRKMADEGVPILISTDIATKIVQWKVRDGATVSSGQVLCLYETVQGENGPAGAAGRCRTSRAGIVRVRAGEGSTVKPGESIGLLEQCRHTTVMADMCAECGADLRADDAPVTAFAVVPMVHSVPELKVTEELAKKLGKADSDRLIRDRKLVLLVDLDQTLVHTTNENVPNNVKNVSHYWLHGRWYHTRLRPGTRNFLRTVAAHYELHVCTFGARQYAHAVARLLDPDREYFSHRILSRDECFDARAKAANLKALFPCGDNMVCIIDDREDVWRHASNLIHVRPYNFFHNTGDINAPPGGDEKGKMISGKNGSSVAGGELPMLDSEPDPKDPMDKDKKLKPKVCKTATQVTDLKDKDAGGLELDPKDSETTERNTEEDAENNWKDKQAEKVDTKGNDAVEADGKEEKDNDGEPKWMDTEDGMVDMDDPDDYLLYLEDILQRIHKRFYELYDSMEAGETPDLKAVIPVVRAQVLAGTWLVFSGLVPQRQPLEASRAYQVARSLGAQVTPDFTPNTTHLLAVRPGTLKVNVGRRMATAPGSKLHVVTAEWLWSCAERWERVDERLYPLQRTQTSARRPPAHCSSPPPPPVAAVRRRTPSGRFMDTLNPLLSFSSADIADMDKEVEDLLSDESDSEGEAKAGGDEVEADDDDDIFIDERLAPTEDIGDSSQDQRLVQDDDSSESNASNASGDSLTEDGARPRKRRRASDAESGEPPDDDNTWDRMGEALEREFLNMH